MLITIRNMQEYFMEALTAVLKKTTLPLTGEAQAYIVQLLSDFTRSEKAYAGVDRGEQPTLAFYLARAKEAGPEEALKIFKHLGDSSLYFLGFFNDIVQHRSVDANYYLSMGESAYHSASQLSREQAIHMSALYGELGDRFGDLVFLLKAVSIHGEKQTASQPKSPSYLLELLERYRKTGNKELLELLIENGMPPDGAGKVLFH